MDLEDFNRRWLEAWTIKSVASVLSFYHAEVRYYDEHVPQGLIGTEALATHLTRLFATMPAWRYEADQLWAISGGFCARWHLTVGDGANALRLRGFDHVVLTGGLISHNEVYTHRLG
ncbi:nuclear transport factor 2 family protein [Sphingomonas sp. ID0503]|uniref:nuclear transport factor 2 family protein n=1 Tax=Sphingomonas sp. ID0503 TaxID=3399691 RepID=UPI003AFA3CB1